MLGQSLFYVPNDLQQGTLYSWNVAFQREIAWGLTGEVAYVGNMSNDVLNRFPMNAGMVVGAGIAGQPLYAKYGKTAGVENLAWKGKTRYNGLQMKLDRRFRNGWLVTNSYTYSRARDYANDNGGPSTPAEPERSWGFGNFDRTHVYVSSFVWSLPWYKNSDCRRPALGPRQLAGVRHLHVSVGPALDITMASAASLNTPGNTQRPNLTGDVQIVNTMAPNKTYLQWFDTTVFSAPAANTFGNTDRNMGDVRGPRVHEPRLQPREAVRLRRQPDGRVPHGRLEPAEHDPHEQPEHVVRQRERSARSPAPTTSARCASAPASLF